MKELEARIESKRAVIAVVGLGHVGLTVAAVFARAGFSVVGVDIEPDVVARISAGESPIGELDEIVRDVTASRRLAVTTAYAPLAEADVIVVAVETPVDADRTPSFAALRAACRDVGRVMRRGTLVIVESTLAPGTCRTIVVPLLAEGSGLALNDGFFVGHCPERVMPGKLLENLRTMPRVCGGASAETCAAMVRLYANVVDAPLRTTDCVTAEIAKAAENTWRDVNIAFANELGIICEDAGADFDRVRELVNELPGRSLLAAGAGVGGSCVPKDPWLLVHGAVNVEPRVVAAAREVNDAMPLHVAGEIVRGLVAAGVAVAGARVAILGAAYLENHASTANSPTMPLALHLRARGAEVAIHDPYAEAYTGDVWDVVRGANAAVIMVGHDTYRAIDLERLARALATPLLVDARRIITRAAARSAGLAYRAIGRGEPRWI